MIYFSAYLFLQFVSVFKIEKICYNPIHPPSRVNLDPTSGIRARYIFFFNSRVMSLQNNAFSEGQSIARPPMFNGNDYAYWKVRMGIYLSSVDMMFGILLKLAINLPL